MACVINPNSLNNNLVKVSKTGDSQNITVPHIIAMKKRGDKIVALTAYDYLFATLLDQSAVDLILVGDSASMVFAGQKTTLPYTMDEAVYHCKSVRRGVRRALVVADMPFMSFQISPEETMKNAGRFFKEAEVDAVKMEGGETLAPTIKKLVHSGMPVMGHLGLMPQSIRNLGGYSVQGKTDEHAQRLIKDAKAVEHAGAFCLVLEKIPHELAKKVTAELSIPTIGIGAGPDCDGQILVTHDMLGLFEKFKPKFVRRYAELAKEIRQAVSTYSRDVKDNEFPNLEESF